MASDAVISPADFAIRRLTVDDLDCLREIRAEAIQTHPQTFGSPEEDGGGDAMVAAYRHWLGDTMLGAFGCGGLIGVAGFYVSRYKRSQHRGHIFSVYVRESDRGKGVGDRLIKELLAMPWCVSSRCTLPWDQRRPLLSRPIGAMGLRSTARIPASSVSVMPPMTITS